MGNPIRIALFPMDIRALAAGQTLRVTIGDLEIELVPREEITGTCQVFFSRLRVARLEWPARERERCLRTVEWYLASGAVFVESEPKPNKGEWRYPITDPAEIIRRNTTCLCLWKTSHRENWGKPSPGKLWRDF